MRIELFGIARARAGREIVDVTAATLADAICALESTCPGLVPDVIDGGRLTDAFLVSLNGERFVRDPATELAEADVLLVLGAQMGG